MSAHRVPSLRPAANALGCLLVLLAAACTQPGATVGSDADPVASADAALTGAQCNYFASNGKVRICHATGSAKNPYTVLNVSEDACVSAHVAHGRDYVASNDPTCSGKGFLPPGAPCDATLACATGFQCRAGTCQATDLCAGVNCSASDQCHVAYCEPTTGQCVNEAKVNDFPCDDGNACTKADSCQAGACVGASPVVCAAADQCHDAGTCDTHSGTCSNPASAATRSCDDASVSTYADHCDGAGACTGSAVTCPADTACVTYAPNGTATCSATALSTATLCDDASASTYADHCDGAGACTGTAVVCPESTECLGYVPNGTPTCTPAPAGVLTSCDDGQPTTYEDHCSGAGDCGGTTVVCPSASPCVTYVPNGTSTCAARNAADGAACNDGNACTQVDSCQAGACTGASPVTCAAADQCHVAGSCDPGTGTCSNPTAADGVACNDGNTCTSDDACEAGACVAAATCLNGSTCLGGSPAICRCTGNYYGATCGQLDVDECATNNGGCPVSAPFTSAISPKAGWTSAGFPAFRDLNLSALGLAAGDTVNLSMLGDFSYIGIPNEGSLAGLFSSSSSISGAIFTTLPTFTSGGIEVAQDFLISRVFHRNTTDPVLNGSQNFNGVRVVIPSGATHLLVELWDNNYADNPVTDSNLAVSVTKVTCLNSLGSFSCEAPAITAPSAPTVTSVTASSGQATVVFTPPTSNGGAPVTSYTVTATPGGRTATGASSPITFTGLTNGVAYTFTVTATNSAGTSLPSNVSARVVPAAVPEAPVILSVIPSDGEVLVTFTEPVSNGSVIIAYNVVGAGQTVVGASSPITVSGLTNGVPVTFTVSATNSVGTSAPSAAASPSVPFGVPGRPVVLGVTGDINGAVSVEFTSPPENGSPILGFEVVSEPVGFSASGSSSPLVVSGLLLGQAYTFTVRAVNLAGSSQWSDPSPQIVPSSTPAAPVIISVVPGDSQVTVSFAPPSDGGAPITRYTVIPDDSSVSPVSDVASPITITGLNNGQSYTFTVRASNVKGEGPSSSPSDSVTPTPGDGEVVQTIVTVRAGPNVGSPGTELEFAL